MPPDPVEIRRLAAEQWTGTVRFQETIEAMYDAGVRIFLEIGPRSNLTSFVQDTLRKKPHLSVASNTHHRSGMTQLNHCLGLLVTHCVSMQLAPLYTRRTIRKVDFKKTSELDSRQKPAKETVALSLGLPMIRLEGDTSIVDAIHRSSAEITKKNKADKAMDQIPPANEIKQ